MAIVIAPGQGITTPRLINGDTTSEGSTPMALAAEAAAAGASSSTNTICPRSDLAMGHRIIREMAEEIWTQGSGERPATSKF